MTESTDTGKSRLYIMMTKELFYQAIMKFVLGVIVIGIMIFLPAGTFDDWNGWLYMGILFIPMFPAGVVMMLKKPELLQKRLNAKAQQSEQKSHSFCVAGRFLRSFPLV